MIGTALSTFCTSLNGESSIDATLLDVLVSTAKNVIEGERPWFVLRKTNTSLSATTSGTWQTAFALSSIADFSRFYGEYPIILFDGTNRIERYRLVPFDRRLEYKNISNTFVYDANAGTFYLNGAVPFSGTLYINYISTSTEVDLSSNSTIWSVFPTRFHPILGFYAVGIYKGAVDYDTINKQMLPEHRATLGALKNMMEKWDNDLQLSELDHNDPTELYGSPRGGAVDRSE